MLSTLSGWAAVMNPVAFAPARVTGIPALLPVLLGSVSLLFGVCGMLPYIPPQDTLPYPLIVRADAGGGDVSKWTQHATQITHVKGMWKV